MTASPRRPLPFPDGLHRSAYDDRAEWMASARFASDLLARTAGRDQLEDAEVLDVGCGTKVVKAVLDDDWPIGRYVGVDVSAEVIDWLGGQVHDPRFQFHHLDARNDLYNPGGRPLDQVGRLPVGEAPFDLICLFSVFTHLDPSDFVTMLKLLRPHLKADGRLVFSLFLTDPTGAWAKLLEQSLASDDPAVVRQANDRIAHAMAHPEEGFVDEVPEVPLLRARYDEHLARTLVADSGGWTIERIEPPGQYIQNYMICRPA